MMALAGARPYSDAGEHTVGVTDIAGGVMDAVAPPGGASVPAETSLPAGPGSLVSNFRGQVEPFRSSLAGDLDIGTWPGGAWIRSGRPGALIAARPAAMGTSCGRIFLCLMSPVLEAS